jgi:hypothetical protein
MCYGMCPVYEVTLQRYGTATFLGEYFVSLMGPHRAALDPEAFRDLALAVAYIGFDSLESQYDAMATDMSTTTTWIDRGPHRTAVVADGDAGPEELTIIDELVDQFASTLDWRPEPRQAPAEGDDGLPIFVGSSLERDELPPFAGDEHAHWTQRRR